MALKKVRDMYIKGLRAHDIEDVKMVDIDDKVDPWYGLSLMVITENQVEELKNGKAIYFSDGEYAHVIALEKVVNGIGHAIEDPDCEYYRDIYGGVCFAQKCAPRCECCGIKERCDI